MFYKVKSRPSLNDEFFQALKKNNVKFTLNLLKNKRVNTTLLITLVHNEDRH